MSESAQSSHKCQEFVAQTPESAVAELVKAANRGDLDAFAAQLGGDSRIIVGAGQALTALQRTVERRFGKKTSSKLQWPPAENELKPYAAKAIEVRAAVPDGEKSLTLTIWMRKEDDGPISEQTWIAVWDGKRWRIVLPEKGGPIKKVTRTISGKEVTIRILTRPSLSKKARDKRNEFFLSIKRSCEKLTKDVKSGKLKSFEEFVQAFYRSRQPATNRD